MIFEKTKISVYINYPFKYVNVISDLIRQYLLYRLRTTRAIFVIDFIITTLKNERKKNYFERGEHGIQYSYKMYHLSELQQLIFQNFYTNNNCQFQFQRMERKVSMQKKTVVWRQNSSLKLKVPFKMVHHLHGFLCVLRGHLLVCAVNPVCSIVWWSSVQIQW